MITTFILAAFISQPVITDNAKQDIVCKKVLVQNETGSRLRRDTGKQICLSADQWSNDEEAANEVNKVLRD